VLVIAGRCGRLANRLVLFANLMAFAHEHGFRLINFTFHSYAHLFENTSGDIYCQYPPPARPGLLDRVPGLAAAIRGSRVFYHLARGAGVVIERWPFLGPGVFTYREPHGSLVSLETPELPGRIQNARLVFLFGWTFRAPNLVQRYATLLRDYFRLCPALDPACRQAVENLRRDADLVIGVHIRQGDYQGWRGGKYYFPIPQYHCWMIQVAEQFPGKSLAFLVSSDEPRHTKEFPGVKVGFAPGVPVLDLYGLAQCDYLMGPCSSFSQWASFYGDVPLLHLRSPQATIDREQFRVSFLEEIPM
jgi:hypothetical protein